jgi:hypothetical protein
MDKSRVEVGEEYMLESYEEYGDYQAHRGQTCKVLDVSGGGSLPVIVQWEDGIRSLVALSNLKELPGADEKMMQGMNEI